MHLLLSLTLVLFCHLFPKFCLSVFILNFYFSPTLLLMPTLSAFIPFPTLELTTERQIKDKPQHESGMEWLGITAHL